MKFLPLSALALLLVGLIYLGLSRVVNPDPLPIPKEDPETHIQFVDTDKQGPECDATTKQIKSLLKAPQTCETAADCEIAYFGCPFGCGSEVNVTHAKAIRSLVHARDQHCSVHCQYRCVSSLGTLVPACLNNLCGAVKTIDAATEIKDFVKENAGDHMP